MKKIKKVLALVLIFAFIVAFAAISASAAQVEEPECCNHDEIVVPARAVPCYNCPTGHYRKLLNPNTGTYFYRCDVCGDVM